MEWKRALFVPSYLAALVPIAAGLPDWRTVVLSQRGPLAVLSGDPNLGAGEVVTGILVGALTVAVTLASIRHPSYGWVPGLVFFFLLWFAFGTPRVWTA